MCNVGSQVGVRCGGHVHGMIGNVMAGGRTSRIIERKKTKNNDVNPVAQGQTELTTLTGECNDVEDKE